VIIYVCNCGEKLIANENIEESRNRKRTWKEKHCKAKGHIWQRRIVKKLAR